MRRFGSITLIAFVVLAARSSAQQPANTVPKYDANGNLTGSAIVSVGSNVGIGTASPYGGTGVTGLTINAPSYPSLALSTGSTQLRGLFWATPIDVRVDSVGALPILFSPSGVEAVRIANGGNVGVGITNPLAKLHVGGVVSAEGISLGSTYHYGGTGVTSLTISAPSYPSLALVTGANQVRGLVWSTTVDMRIDSVGALPILFSPNGSEAMRIANGGSVGIGTASPASGSKLHVAGNVTVDGNLSAKFQDVAEWVDANEPLSPGTVAAIDENSSNVVRQSRAGYEMAVAGVISPQPGIVLGENGPGRVLVAQSGRVRVKVDASYGAIRAGDVLVTSPTPGHAMRSTPVDVGGVPMHRPGTILGKALESLASGKGEVLVLLTLQ